MFSQVRRKPRSLVAAILGVLALLSVVVSSGPVAAAKQIQFEFNFVNGTQLTGTASGNVAFLPDAGGTDADNPIGMNVHVSCSDKFVGGFGQKDGPDPQRDSAWQIASYSIGEVKGGTLTLKCGDSFSPPGPPPVPAIKLVKTVNGQDANSPTGPRVTVGDTVTLGYKVTNTGNIDLQSVSVTDLDLGPVSCPKDTLAPDESMTCDEAQVLVSQPGQVFMEARTDAVGKSTAPATPPAGSGKHGFIFVFENGQTVTGTSQPNVAFLPDAGGTDANNPIGMNVHVSCSDKFVGGFGQKDGPDPQRDSAWQIASYTIFKDGKLACGDANTTVMIPVSDTDPIHYIADPLPPTLSPPPDCSVAIDSAGDVKITWDAGEGATIYAVKRNNTWLGRTTSLMFVDSSNLAPGMYEYFVRSINGADRTDYVSCGKITIPEVPTTPPGPPVCSVFYSNGRAVVSWAAVGGARAYQVRHNGFWQTRTTELTWTDDSPGNGVYTVEAVFANEVKSTRTTCEVVQPPT